MQLKKRGFDCDGAEQGADSISHNDLFERRQESDYVDFVSFESFQIRPLMEKAASFVECIANLIEENN
jgi:hypothetical protein